MAHQKRESVNSVVTVKNHNKLPGLPQAEFTENAEDVLREADRGNQTTLRGRDGSVKAVVGLNGHRFFPDPNPDPLDEILRLALNTDKVEQE